MAMLQGYNFAGGPVYPGKKKKKNRKMMLKFLILLSLVTGRGKVFMFTLSLMK